MSTGAAPEGRDFSLGIPLVEVPENGTVSGRAGEEAVLLSRFDGELFAVSGTCTHYGAMLATGLFDGDAVRCPLHHACFNLRTGRALRAPALDPLDLWQVEVEQNQAFVRRKREAQFAAKPRRDNGVDKVVIVGGGAAGLACANELRVLGYSGAITMLSADSDAPVDRPNLSKDFLAGTAPDEWMPLRSDDWYREQRIDLRLECEAVRIDPADRRVHSSAGDDFAFDRLLLATGSEPNRLQAPGFDDDRVFTLRSFADARAIIGRLRPGMRAAIIGSSFIGLEAAAALRKRDIEAVVISPETLPFEGVFGSQVGGFLKGLHERNGVGFHLKSAAGSFDGRSVSLSNGGKIEADIVLVGIGVRPRTALAASAGLSVPDGVGVDAYLETGIPGVFAAGDIASYRDPMTGESVRIEHWVTAERQGQAAAANMLGFTRPYRAVPFFWTEQYGVALRYVGHSRRFDEIAFDGSLESGEFVARYFERGVHLASAAVGRDVEILEDERRLEQALARAMAEEGNHDGAAEA